MDLKVIEHQNQRVLTTSHLAESYGATTDKISYNFKYNEKRYKEGKHFYLLTGEALKEFKNANHEFQGSLNRLYLWTEKGAWLHAKSLNTDQAWDAYEMLVDDYYNVKNQSQQAPSLEIALQAALEHEREIKTIKSDVTYLKGSMRIDSLQQQDLQQAGKKSVVHALGGKDSNAYQQMSGKTFSAFWKEFKQHFGVPRYPDLPKVKFDDAIRFIELWRPSTSLQMDIDSCNSQMQGV